MTPPADYREEQFVQHPRTSHVEVAEARLHVVVVLVVCAVLLHPTDTGLEL